MKLADSVTRYDHGDEACIFLDVIILMVDRPIFSYLSTSAGFNRSQALISPLFPVEVRMRLTIISFIF